MSTPPSRLPLLPSPPPPDVEEAGVSPEAGAELSLLLGALSHALPTPEGPGPAQGEVPGGLAYFDVQGRHRYVSGPYAARLGASASALLGRGLREVLGEAAGPVEDGPLRRALGGESARWEGTLAVGGAGPGAPLQLRCVPHPRPDGTLAGVLALLSGGAPAPGRQTPGLEALGASLDLRTTLAALSAHVVPAHADWCVVDVLADDGRLERLEVAHADPGHAPLAARVRALAPAPLPGPEGRRTERVWVVPDVGTFLASLPPLDAERTELLRQLHARSLLVLPLLARGRRLGVLTLVRTGEAGRCYTEADAAVGEALAHRASLALDNALLHRAAQEARERTERLLAVTAALSDAASPAEVADVIATQGTLALGADAGVVMVLSGDGRELRLASARGYPAEALAHWGHLPLELSTPLTDAVRLTEPVQLASAQDRDLRYPLLQGPHAPHGALAAVALRAGTRVMGVVGLSFLGPRTLSPPERELLLALARQGGQALERARLYEAERRARREAQEALRAGEIARSQLAASEARFRRVVDSGMLGICFWDASGRVTDANAVFLSLVGRTRAELGTLRLDALLPEPLAHEELERRGVHAPYETELARVDGARVPVLMGGARLGPGGAGVSFVLDVTERHRAEAERADTLSLLGSLLATAPVGLCFVDRQLRFTHVNDSLAALDHQPVEAHLGRRVSDVVGPPLAPLLERPLRRVFEEGRALLDEELSLPRGDGSPGHFQASFYPVHDRTGQVVLAGTVLVDLTERKRAEEQLREAAEFRERFLGIVSHDLRTPLQASTLAASLLLRSDDLSERHQKLARRIATSTERMGRMICELLDFTRSRLGGGIPVERRRVNLAQLCQEVLDEVELGAQGGQLRLGVEGACEGEWDPGRIAQVVQNLVTNALKHGRAGAPVTLRLTGEPGGVRLAVHNEGAPIPAELLPELFNPFRRGAGPRAGASPVSEGLGLGLYIARAVLAAHGGSIEAHSSAEAGTTFQVYLPRSAPEPISSPG